MSGVNKVILIGNLGQDPELRNLDSGAVCSISIATSEKWKDKNSGETHEKTEWHRCVLWNRLAEIANQYLTKGSKVYVEGKLQTRKYQKDGVDHYATEVVVRELQMLDGRRDGGQQGRQQAPQQETHAGVQDDDVPF